MEIAKLGIILAVLIYASILDVRYREVEPKVWLFTGIPVAILTILIEWAKGFPKIDFMYIFLNTILVVAAVGGLYYANLMGGGDLFSLVIVAYSNPVNPLVEIGFIKSNLGFNMPFIIPVLLYSSVIAIMYSLVLSLYNLILNKSEVKRLPRRVRILYIATARPIRVKDLLKKRFWYPLERPWSKDRFKFAFNVEEDDVEIINTIRMLVSKGKISLEDKLWCTYGLPFILFITIGLIVSCVGGDIILVKVLTSLVS